MLGPLLGPLLDNRDIFERVLLPLLDPTDLAMLGRAGPGGHQEVLQWAREHHCPWDGPLWAVCMGRVHGPPWAGTWRNGEGGEGRFRRP